jgi:hypothetical protein
MVLVVSKTEAPFLLASFPQAIIKQQQQITNHRDPATKHRR